MKKASRTLSSRTETCGGNYFDNWEIVSVRRRYEWDFEREHGVYLILGPRGVARFDPGTPLFWEALEAHYDAAMDARRLSKRAPG